MCKMICRSKINCMRDILQVMMNDVRKDNYIIT